MIHLLGSALIMLAAVEAVACAVFYGACFRWWTSHEGHHLFRFTVVIAGAIGLWAGLLLTGGNAWTTPETSPRDWLRLATFGPIDVVLAERFWFMVKGKRDEIRARREPHRGD